MTCKHEFISSYDISETIPEGVIASASRYRESSDEADILKAGKVKVQKHVMTYCKHCGVVLTPNGPRGIEEPKSESIENEKGKSAIGDLEPV